MKTAIRYLLLLLTCGCFSCLHAQTDTTKNIVYATIPGKSLLLDLYMPAGKKEPYLIVWIHGGAWRSGSKKSPPTGMLPHEYALASINYRLSEEAIFPAPIHDIKAAIRFLRANAKKYGYRSDKIIIWGSSAGGHLAALAGLTNNNLELEGNIGAHTNESSSVQVILDFFGPSNFLTILNQSTPHGLGVRVPSLKLLLGKPVEEVPELARKASPVYHVDSSDPPILIVHGDQDIQVPINQSLELLAACKKNKVAVQLEIIPGAGHGGAAYDDKELMNTVKQFLESALKNK
ncbi:MAG: alpha/beta hydrolase [Bacteroidota bacterium]